MDQLDHSSVCWQLNAPLTCDRVYSQIAAFQQAGFTSVLPAPFANDTADRPASPFAGSGMGCNYLSEEFFNQYALVVEACNHHGLKIWVWDDDFCPAGRAGGTIVKMHPHLRAQVLHRMSIDQPLPEGMIEVLREDERFRYLVAYANLHKSSADTFNAQAAQLYLELNYDAYRQRFGNLFGHVIAGFFMDEPGFPGSLTGRFRTQKGYVSTPIPWTNGILDQWSQSYHCDLLDFLPQLFWQDADSHETCQIRADFGALMHSLWIQRWMLPLREWCHQQGVLFAGHMNNDDYVEASLASAGNVLDSISHFDVPGVDAVVRQIVPDKEIQPEQDRSIWDVNHFNSDFPRLASSAARAQSVPRASCELGDAYGWSADLALRKWLLDYHLARGLDLVHWGAIQYSVQEQNIMATSGHFGPGQPFWRYWGELNRYAGRMIDLLCRGIRCAKSAIFYPGEGYMQGTGTLLNEKTDALAAFLLAHGVDFDYVQIGCAVTGVYRQLFVPGGTPISDRECCWLIERTKECQVVAPANLRLSGAMPYVFNKVPYHRGQIHEFAQKAYAQLTPLMKPDIRIQVPHRLSFHQRTVTDDQILVFVFNESTLNEAWFSRELRPNQQCFMYDPLDDAFSRVGEAKIVIGPAESRLLFFGTEQVVHTKLQRAVKPPKHPIDQEITLHPHRGKLICAERHFWDGQEIMVSPVSQQKLRILGTEFSGCISRLQTIRLDEIRGDLLVKLQLPKFGLAVELCVNNQMVGVACWAPWQLRVPAKLLRGGANAVKMTVCNTLANHVRSSEFLTRLDSLGIDCDNTYFQMTRSADCLAASFRPVRKIDVM